MWKYFTNYTSTRCDGWLTTDDEKNLHKQFLFELCTFEQKWIVICAITAASQRNLLASRDEEESLKAASEREMIGREELDSTLDSFGKMRESQVT